DPANLGSLVGLFKHILGKAIQNMDGMLPVRVITATRTRVSVQPLIAVLASDNKTTIPRAVIDNVPVLLFGAGNAGISFNIKAGDFGWIMANDRDISTFLNSYQESAPNTLRKKSFSDSLFIPDIMRNFTINPEDEEAGAAVFQTTNGAVRVALWMDRVKITPLLEVAGTVLIDGNATVTGTATFNSGFSASAGGGGNVGVINGDFRVNGNITASGDITPHS